MIANGRILPLTMARTQYRKLLLRSYAFYMLSRMLILPARTMDRMICELQLDADIIRLIVQTRYLRDRHPVKKAGNLHLAWEYAQSPSDHHRFTQMLRVTPESFQYILQLIEDHPVFTTTSHRPQTPVEIQLAVTLYRMGRFGNGASIKDIARTAGVSEGAVERFTERCFEAIHLHHDKFIRPLADAEKEREKAWMEKNIGCVGWREGWVMYDGTIVVLFQKPGLNGDAYYTRKANYGLNVQVCSIHLTSHSLT